MTPAAAADAAKTLWAHRQAGTKCRELPAAYRPGDRRGGYLIQAALVPVSGEAVVGWKIAATSAAGQRHIGVDGPLAGRLFSGRHLEPGAAIPLANNMMNVAEAEFAFRMARDLAASASPYGVDDVMAAVETLHPAIEVPDSRYENFAVAGGPQLIADNACGGWFLIGAAAPATWRKRDLAAHRVVAYRDDALASEGGGANVLGDPRLALTWLANEVCELGDHLRAGDIIMTGTCVPPVAVAPGQHVRMDFGEFGAITARFIG